MSNPNDKKTTRHALKMTESDATELKALRRSVLDIADDVDELLEHLSRLIDRRESDEHDERERDQKLLN